MSKPKYIIGGRFSDERGIIYYTNDFVLSEIKRFYTIEHIDINTVRAWQGHQIETKYFWVLKGKFVVAWVKIDDFNNPSEELLAEFKVLNGIEPGVLFIPPGYANGLRALEPNSIIGVFSDMEVEKSVKEKKRYSHKLWFDWFQNFK